jgi:vitamin B12 transporter
VIYFHSIFYSGHLQNRTGMKKQHYFFAATALLAWPSLAFAQATDSIKVELQDVIITATKTEKSVSETGRSISVITRGQIQNSTCATVADLLSTQEGIYVVGNGQTPGANQSIFMRGANSNQTAVLIDGVRMNDASTVNNTLDLSELSLVDVEQIEIIRGSHSTLYGSSAIGGVINIITTKHLNEGLSTHLVLQGGTFGTSTFQGEAAASAAYKLKSGWWFKGIYDQLHVDGLDATLDTVTDPAVFKNRDRDGWDKLTAGASSGFQNDRWDLQASYRFVRMKTDLDLSAYTDDDNYTLDFTRQLVHANASYKLSSRWLFFVAGSYSSTERDAQNDSSVTDAAGTYDHAYNTYTYSGQNASADVQANYLMRYGKMIAGYNLANEKMNQKSYYYSPYFESNTDLDTLHPEASLNSLFAQADLNGALLGRGLDAFNLLVGGRFVKHTFFDPRFTFQVNPSIKISDRALFYISCSTGYNAPSLYQLYAPDLYYTYDLGYTTGLTLGNKSLKPETSSSFEIGFKQKLTDQFQFNVSVFRTVTHNVIDYVYLWDKNIGIDTLGNDFNRDDFRGSRYLNIGRETAEGIEIAMSSVLSEKCSLQANITLVNGKINYHPEDADSVQTGGNHIQLYNNGIFLTGEVEISGLTRRPPTANVQFNYSPVKKLNLGFSLQYVNARTDVFYDSNLGPYGALNSGSLSEYALAGFQAGYSFNKNMTLHFRMENIFDEKYEEIYGYTTRGRGGYLKLAFSW